MATITDPRDIILSPVISEKSYGLIEDNVYTFVVHPDSNKTQIKIAIEKIFKVKVDVGEHRQPAGQAQAHPRRATASARTPSARIVTIWRRAASRSTCSERRSLAGAGSAETRD